MGHMSDRYDPTRQSTKCYTTKALNSWLWGITKERVRDDWKFGLAPYGWKHPPPLVTLLHLS